MEEIVEENGHVAVDLGGLLASYGSLVNMDGLTGADEPCIFEIPKTLYRHNKTAYLPNAFSFGPLHYGKPDLEAAQVIKFKFLQSRYFGHQYDLRRNLAEAEKAVHENLVKVRQCYAKRVHLDDELFVKILVLDGFLITNLFFKHYLDKKNKQNMGTRERASQGEYFKKETEFETKINTAYLLQCLYHDLILLENQIPWFVLELLFDLLYVSTEFKEFQSAHLKRRLMLREGAIHFFSNMFSHDGLSIPPALLEEEKVEHILDLLRKALFLSSLSDEKKVQSSYLENLFRNFLLSPLWKSLLRPLLRKLLIAPEAQVPELEMQVPSASRLKEAGVKFKKGGSLRLNITFREGVLEIPSLLIHDSTETIFRNLIAFEQCYPDCPPIVTSYAKFMDNLIDTVEDIDILCKNGIICNSLNPEDATKFFNSLYNSTYISCNHYADTYRGVNRYCQRWWPRWRAFYIHNYFGKPWAIFSQIFAFFILALTILQVIRK